MIQTVPGYMDAEYYYAGGLQLANGAGFNEPFLWNYLDNPVGLPHSSHTYWMPLPSLIAAAGMLLTGSRTFLSARLIFILLAACIPLVTALLAEALGQDKTNAMLAGLLAAFPGFYVVYSSNTETFTLYMLLGAVFFGVASKRCLRIKSFYFKIGCAGYHRWADAPDSGRGFYLAPAGFNCRHLRYAENLEYKNKDLKKSVGIAYSHFGECDSG